MAKRTKKSKKFLKVELTLIVLIIISSLISLYLYNEITNNNKILKVTNKNLLKENSQYKENSNNIKKLVQKIKDFNNLDKSIEDTKKEYFDTLKKLEDDILAGKSTKKIAYLTFDDGPYYNTYKVLNILDENDVKATFFTISMNGEYCYDNKSENCFKLYKEYATRGHTIANHTYTHGIKTGLYSSTSSFMDAIDKQEEHIKNQSGGYVARIVRFPGGSSTAKNLKQPIINELRNKGYGWVDWTAGDGDGGRLSSNEQAMANFKSTINSNIEVVLFHDYNRYTTNILPDAIKYLRDNGYELYPLFYESNMINK